MYPFMMCSPPLSFKVYEQPEHNSAVYLLMPSRTVGQHTYLLSAHNNQPHNLENDVGTTEVLYCFKTLRCYV